MFSRELSVTTDEWGSIADQLRESLFPIEIEIVESIYKIALEGFKENRQSDCD